MVMVTAAPTQGAPLPRPSALVLDLKSQPFRKRLEMLRSERSFYEAEMREVSRFIRPRRGRFLGQRGQKDDNRQSSDIINTTATIASRTLKSGMQSGVSSPARPWFRLTTPDPDLSENGAVKDYLTTVARRMATVFQRSNIYNSLHTGYGDLGDFGTSVMMIDEDYQDVIRCHTYSPGTYFLALDARGAVGTIYREFSLTVMACVERWGRRVSPTVMQMYDQSNFDAMVDIVEAVEPNMQQVRGVPGPRGMPYLRVHFEKNANADTLLDCKGCHEFPACAPRWEVRDDDVYGYGPGLEVLNDVKGLQLMEIRKQIMVDKMATPPTQGGASSMLKINHRAGGHTFTPDAAAMPGGKLISPLYEMNGQGIQAVASEITRSESRIKDGYFYDLFLMFAQSDRREITAREVDERHEEKLLALGPVLERLHNENLDPAITRTFNIMHRAGILPDPPQELQGMDLKVQFISTLAQAQRAVAIGGIENCARFLGGLAGVFPSVVDKFDADQAMDEYADATGVPPGIILSDDKVAAIRADKEKAAQGQAAIAAAGQGAELGQTLSQTEVTPDNMLGQILGGVGAV